MCGALCILAATLTGLMNFYPTAPAHLPHNDPVFKKKTQNISNMIWVFLIFTMSYSFVEAKSAFTLNFDGLIIFNTFKPSGICIYT